MSDPTIPPTLSGDEFDFVRDFGAVGDGSTDNLPAWERAMRDMGPVQDGNFYNDVGATLKIPRGQFFFSATPKVSRQCIIQGSGGYGSWPRTQLIVPPGCDGLEVVTSRAVGSIVSRLRISTPGWTEDEVHGMRIHSQCQVYDVFLYGFGGDGFFVRGNDGEGTNANGTIIGGKCDVRNIRGHGIHTSGTDGGNVQVSGVTVEGVKGSGARARQMMNAGFTNCYFENCDGGPVHVTSEGCTLFTNCYAEHTLTASDGDQPSMWIGGVHGYAATGKQMTPESTMLMLTSLRRGAPMSIVNERGAVPVETLLGFDSAMHELLGYRLMEGTDAEREPYLWKYLPELLQFQFQFGRTENGVGAAHTAWGHPRGPNKWFFPFGVGLGKNGSWGDQAFLSAWTRPPDNGRHAAGDIAINVGTDFPAVAWWRCTAPSSEEHPSGVWEEVRRG